jgi:ABC-2 type transport system permease protein
MTHSTTSAGPLVTSPLPDVPGELIWLLLRLRLRLLGNRMRQLADQSPLRVILVLAFLAVIWGALYGIFDYVFTFLRRFEQQAVIAIPLIFHVFVMAMTLLLTFSAAILVYSALFTRAEPAFLLTTPTHPRSVVTVMYLEALFFASWSLVLLGLPLMLAVGRVEDLPWHFYLLFAGAFLAFVPIPGAIGLVAAIAVATWLPRLARRAVIYLGGGALLLVVLWWGRLWGLSTADTDRWLQSFLGEMQFLKGALLPSTWVTNTIRFGIENRPADAFFYLGVTASTALFFSWASVSWAGKKLIVAYGRAVTAGGRRVYEGRPSRILTRALFFYLPIRMRQLALKDVRSFLRDPAQWSQLAILFGLLALYLISRVPAPRDLTFNGRP